MNCTQAEAIEKQILEAVKNKLVEMGYLTDDRSMKVCSTIFEKFSDLNPNPYYIARFDVNDDYIIFVCIKISNIYNNVLNCNLHINTYGNLALIDTGVTFEVILTNRR